jgi:undecaprenyl-phosphate galactose phosphotransferase/putative colanic acid biosynthesis UDP-glucose lipid carrier transferase
MSVGSEIRDKIPLDELSGTRPAYFSSNAIPYLLPLADGLVILLSSLAGGVGYHMMIGNPIPSLPPYLAVGVLASMIHILRMNGKGYYDFPDSAKPRVELSEILVCWITTALLLALFAFLLKVGVDYSRGSFIIFCLLGPLGLIGVRKVTKLALTEAVSRGAIGRRDTVLVGEFKEISALEPQDLLAFAGATEISRFILSREDDPSARSLTDGQIISAAANFVRRNNCREILLALPWNDTDRIEFIREQIKTLPVVARLLPDTRVRCLSNFTSSARQRVLAIEVQRAPLSGTQRLIKRTMDLCLAALALVFFLPIMTLTAIAIKFDSPGPVIFRQTRNGFNGRRFDIFKFRTMTVQENGPTVLQATRDDPRVTAIGRLLRSASIDELPQLLNVLKGDMSLIGPRPHALAHDSYFENLLSDYAFRHHVKPGITGWAQCNGARGATPSIEHISERVKLDLWYINNWSLWLDVQILIRTFFEVLKKRNAY